MTTVRIALANIRPPATPEDSVRLATAAVTDAGRRGAMVICFPECFVPGYRWPGTTAPPPDPAFLERAWAAVGDAARTASITVVLGTERVTDRGLQATACAMSRRRIPRQLRAPAARAAEQLATPAVVNDIEAVLSVIFDVRPERSTLCPASRGTVAQRVTFFTLPMLRIFLWSTST
jgi:predicted amidohydrolase